MPSWHIKRGQEFMEDLLREVTEKQELSLEKEREHARWEEEDGRGLRAGGQGDCTPGGCAKEPRLVRSDGEGETW